MGRGEKGKIINQLRMKKGEVINELRKLQELRKLALAGVREGVILTSFRKGMTDDAERNDDFEGGFAGA